MGSGDDAYWKRASTGNRGTRAKTETGTFEGYKVDVKLFDAGEQGVIKIEAPVKFPVSGLWVPARMTEVIEPDLDGAHIRTSLDKYCAMCLSPKTIPKVRTRYEPSRVVVGNMIDIPYIQDGRCVIGPPEETRALLQQTLDLLVEDFLRLRWEEKRGKPIRVPKAFQSMFGEPYQVAERQYLWDGHQVR